MNRLLQEFAYLQLGNLGRVDHRHINGDNCEILIVLAGGGTLLTGSNTYPLHCPSLVLIDSSYPHCVNPQEPEKYLRSKMILSRKHLCELCRAGGFPDLWKLLLNGSTGLCVPLTEAETQNFDRLFRGASQTADDDSILGKAQFAVQVLSVILEAHRAVNGRGSDGQPVQYDKRVHDIADYICAHLSEELTIDGIADAVHFSRYYLCHLFRTQTGMSVMRYLYTQRVSMALRLMENRKLSVGEIALQCGFAGASHFCRHFKEYTGLSPSEYRKMITEDRDGSVKSQKGETE